MAKHLALATPPMTSCHRRPTYPVIKKSLFSFSLLCRLMPQINQLKRQWQIRNNHTHMSALTGLLAFRGKHEHTHNPKQKSCWRTKHLRNCAITLRFLPEIAAVCWVTSHQSCCSQCSQSSQKQQTFWNSAVWYLQPAVQADSTTIIPTHFSIRWSS